jgi:hypothetical protein
MEAARFIAIFVAIFVAIFAAISCVFIGAFDLSGERRIAAQDRRMAEHRMNARLLRSSFAFEIATCRLFPFVRYCAILSHANSPTVSVTSVGGVTARASDAGRVRFSPGALSSVDEGARIRLTQGPPAI